MHLNTLIDETKVALEKAGLDEAAFEARQLVQEALDITFAQVISRPDRELTQALVERIRAWTAARAEGQPLAYLSKRRGFYKHDFIVEPGVLVPRPETELVVETALRRIDQAPAQVSALADLGCGTGCIGLSLLAELSSAHLSSIDASDEACRVTLRNAEALSLKERVNIEKTRVEAWRPHHKFDVIVANPPYIAEHDARVEAGVRRFEPALALFAGDEGLEAIKAWSEWSFRHLEKGGIFVCEFGIDQSPAVQDHLAHLGFVEVQVERDLAGIDRVISGLRAR